MKRLLFLIILIFSLVTASGAWGATYYCDCSADPGGDGSLSSPWDTLADINSAGLTGDDTTYVYANCRFRESLVPTWSGTDGHQVKIVKLGPGANPIVDGSDPVTAWSHPISGAAAPFYYGESFESGFWEIGAGASVTDHAAADPVYAANDASTIAAVTPNTYMFVRKGTGLFAGTQVTVSLYVHKIDHDYVALQCGASGQAVFDLSSGTFLSDGGYTTAVSDAGGGWYRISATNTPGAGTVYFGFTLTDASGDTTPNMSGVSALVFGFLLNVGASPAEYVRVDDNLYVGYSSTTIYNVFEADSFLEDITWNTDLATTAALMSAGDFSYNSNNVFVMPATAADLYDGSIEFAKRAYGLDINGQSYITVQGLDFIKSYYRIVYVRGAAAGIIVASGRASLGGRMGVLIEGASSATIRDFAINYNLDDGGDISGDGTVGNFIGVSSNFNGGYSAVSGDGFSAHNTSTLILSYCSATGNTRSGSISLNSSSGTVTNCTFAGNGRIGLATGAGVWTVKNTILANNGDGSDYELSLSPGATSDYNVVYNPARENCFYYDGSAYNFAGWQGLGFGAHSINLDPLLRSATNLRLAPESPARNAGDSAVWNGVPNVTDLDGRAITDGSGNVVAPGGVDIGAFEFIGGFVSMVITN